MHYHCPTCAYDLRGSPGVVCPECGGDTDPKSIEAALAQRHYPMSWCMLWTLAIAGLFILIGIASRGEQDVLVLWALCVLAITVLTARYSYQAARRVSFRRCVLLGAPRRLPVELLIALYYFVPHMILSLTGMGMLLTMSLTQHVL